MGLFARNSGIRVLGQVPLEILKRSRLRAGKYTFWVLPGREEMDKCHSRPEMVGPPSAWTDARGAGAGETDEGRKSGAALPTAGPEGKHHRDKEARARRDVRGGSRPHGLRQPRHEAGPPT